MFRAAPTEEANPKGAEELKTEPCSSICQRLFPSQSQQPNLRVVLDACAKSNGVALNDCLYLGPLLAENMFDVYLSGDPRTKGTSYGGYGDYPLKTVEVHPSAWFNCEVTVYVDQ